MPVCKCCVPPCCEGTTCTEKSRADCNAADGMSRQRGLTCQDVSCDPCGACCVVNDVVYGGLTEETCGVWVEAYCTLDNATTTASTESSCLASSYCEVAGSVVSATDQTACEAQGACFQNNVLTNDTQSTCSGGCNTSPWVMAPITTQAECEATYIGCNTSGGFWEMPESQCTAGDFGPNGCAVILDTTNAEDCPADWFFNGTYCITYICVEDCGECEALASSTGGTMQTCVATPSLCDATRTKVFATWAGTKEWVPGVWHAATWFPRTWVSGDWYAECPSPNCLSYVHAGTATPLYGTFFEETLYVPAGCDTVVLRGSVDDDIKIDGEIIQANEFVTSQYPTANPAHSVHYEFTPAGTSFTIAVKDNWGINVSANLRICFYASVGGLGMLSVGPGTELKKLLAKFGIHATPNCKCNKMAKKMNDWGPDESLKHIEEIVDVMEEEAKKRKLPFLRTAGRILVRKAIRNSRGNSQ